MGSCVVSKYCQAVLSIWLLCSACWNQNYQVRNIHFIPKRLFTRRVTETASVTRPSCISPGWEWHWENSITGVPVICHILYTTTPKRHSSKHLLRVNYIETPVWLVKQYRNIVKSKPVYSTRISIFRHCESTLSLRLCQPYSIYCILWSISITLLWPKGDDR